MDLSTDCATYVLLSKESEFGEIKGHTCKSDNFNFKEIMLSLNKSLVDNCKLFSKSNSLLCKSENNLKLQIKVNHGCT